MHPIAPVSEELFAAASPDLLEHRRLSLTA